MPVLVSDRLPAPLPSEHDFDPYAGDLDAQHAWRNFGGLSLDDAYVKFCQFPEVYQEDFMFMGSRAFHYYFPVIDAYLRSVEPCDEWDDCQADILGSCVARQFEWKGAYVSPALRDRISDLCAFVLGHLSRLAWSPVNQERIRVSWTTVAGKLRSGGTP